MEGLLSELDYLEPKVTQRSVMGDYDRVFGTGQTIIQAGELNCLFMGPTRCIWI